MTTKVLATLFLLVLGASQTTTFTHNRFTENGKTFSQDGTSLITSCIFPQPSALASEDTQIEFYQNSMLCSGYILGVADFLSYDSVCVPPEIAAKELTTVVVKYAAKHEDKMHGPASSLVAAALQGAYPCAAKK